MINYEEEVKRIITIKVPHSISDLFYYDEWETGNRLDTHYGTYHLSQLIEDMEETDYDLDKADKDLIYEIFNFCEQEFNKEPLQTVVKFVDEDYV